MRLNVVPLRKGITRLVELIKYATEYVCNNSKSVLKKSPRSAKTLYLHILETYLVKWSRLKVARDILQNFFDADLSLDKTELRTFESNGKFYIEISHPDASYCWDKLVHLGGSSKTKDSLTVGQFGEGAKIAALCLLRDYEVSAVVYRSGDWQVNFFLDTPPKGTYDEPTKGLYAYVKSGLPLEQGNKVIIETTDKDLVRTFQDAFDLFYRTGHPDFQNPDFEIALKDGARLGFKILLNGSQLQKGRFYNGGQAVFYQQETAEPTLEGLCLWLLGGKIPDYDRDRSVILLSDFQLKYLSEIIHQVETDDLVRILQKLEPVWPLSSCDFTQAVAAFRNSVCEELRKRQVRLKFISCYVAFDLSCTDAQRQALECRGYVICSYDLAMVGMQTVSDLYHSLLENQIAQVLSERHNFRLEILKKAAQLVLGEQAEIPEIFILEPTEHNPAMGLYREGKIYLSTECLEGDFPNALTTLLHEYYHLFGPDGSEQFSYALTYCLGKIIRLVTQEDKFAEHLRDLEENWKQI